MIQWLRKQMQEVKDIAFIFRTPVRRMGASSNVL
jgi:hypothetical protein